MKTNQEVFAKTGDPDISARMDVFEERHRDFLRGTITQVTLMSESAEYMGYTHVAYITLKDLPKHFPEPRLVISCCASVAIEDLPKNTRDPILQQLKMATSPDLDPQVCVLEHSESGILSICCDMQPKTGPAQIAATWLSSGQCHTGTSGDNDR